jgi:hypothetical protein
VLERCGSGLLVHVWAYSFFCKRCKSVRVAWVLLLLLLRSGRWRVFAALRR